MPNSDNTFEACPGHSGCVCKPIATNTIYRHKPTGLFYLEWTCLSGFCVIHEGGSHVHRVNLGTTDLKEAQLWGHEKYMELKEAQRGRWPRLTLVQPFSSGTYFIQASPAGPIKIGFSAQILKRLYSLYKFYRDHNVSLTLIGVLGEDREKELHALFKTSSLIGEWFCPTPDLVQFLKNHGITSLRSGFGSDRLMRLGKQPLSVKEIIDVIVRTHKVTTFRRKPRIPPCLANRFDSDAPDG